MIFPGQTVSIQFSAAKGQAISFATMYGWSNDLFFAPANPGIQVYDSNGNPIEGDVSSQVKLWDNGTRVNQIPGAIVSHPGVQEAKVITEVRGMEAQGNAYLPASSLVKATLSYNGNSVFTLKLQNISAGSSNETPLSPGVWAVSYVAGGQLLNPSPLYSAGISTANGLTNLAETGINVTLKDYLTSITSIFTPLSPVLIVVYHGVENPVYKLGEPDCGQGLKALAQKGKPQKGYVLVKNKAFGLNRAEVYMRKGEFREIHDIIGIEFAGIVEDDPSGTYEPGHKVISFIGGLTRKFGGSYAKYICVPPENITAIETELPWN